MHLEARSYFRYDNQPIEYFGPNSRWRAWYGYTEDFQKYPNIQFNFPPISFHIHQLNGWRLEINQKTSGLRCYVHLHNKKNFGFRVRLPAKKYNSVDEIISSMSLGSATFKESENSFTNVVEKEVLVRDIVKEMSFEQFHINEREQILNRIGDYRGGQNNDIDFSENIINISDYLKEPKQIEPTEQVIEQLFRAIG